MKLYHSPQAPNPERVTKFLKAKGKLDAVEIEEISIMKQEHKSEAYREVSPFSQARRSQRAARSVPISRASFPSRT